MNKTKNILSILFIILLISCGQNNEPKKKLTEATKNYQTKADSIETERLKRRKQIEEEDRQDSIRLEKVLKSALDTAYKYISLKNYKKEFIINCDTAFNVNVMVAFDYYFTKTNPHLIIRRTNPNVILIDIYSKTNGTFNNVLSHEQWTLTYVNDTIRDINGDNMNDFVVNWYGSTGCCLKGFSNVYLLRKDNISFSKDFEFINPTFSPKEKVIRGICYGHPGETEIYKYKWNEEKIDTIEYISYEKDSTNKNTGKIIVSNKRPYSDDFKILRKLKSIPKEYKKIDGFDWFTGELNGN